MAAKRYSAGRIFLQVVPSFDNLQREIGREVNKANPALEKQAAEAGRRRGDAAAAAEAKAHRERTRREESTNLGNAKRAAEKLGSMKIQVADKTTRALLKQYVDEKEAERQAEAQHQSRLGKMAGEGIMQRARAAHEANLQAQKDEADHQRRVADILAKSRAKSIADNLAERKAEQAELDRINKRAMAGRIRDAQQEHQSNLNLLRKQHEEAKRLSGGEFGQTLKKAARGAADALPNKPIDLNSDATTRRIAALRAELLSLSDAHIGVDLDMGEFQAKIALIEAELKKIAKEHPSVDMDVNIASALAKIKLVDEAAKHAGDGRGRRGGMFAGLAGEADQGANSFRVFNWRVFALVALLPALIPLLGVAAGGIGALATAAVGGAAGLGVMILAFSGIGTALTAMQNVKDNAQKDALMAGKAMRVAAKNVRDAQEGLSKARMDAARAAEDSNRRIADAEKKLAASQRDATDAQEKLRAARKQAQQDQQDLADKIAKGKLDERQALIDLFNAQVAYNAAIKDGGATNLEKEQASIDLGRAQLAIKGIRADNKALAAESQQSAKVGVEGDQNVVQAKRDVADATARVADAQQGVKDAQRDAARQQIDSTLAVRDAVERLHDSQDAYQEALTKTGTIGVSNIDALRTAMGKLSPAGQAFATYLFSLQGLFYKLRGVAQEGMLPGVTKAIQLIVDRYGPSFIDFVGRMAKVAGDLFVALGNAFVSPTMVAFFAAMDKYAPDFFAIWGKLGIDAMKIIAGLMTAFAPFADEFMQGFLNMADGWAKWSATLKDNPAFQQFIAYVKEVGPQVLKLIGDLALTLLHIGQGMADNGTFSALVGVFDYLSKIDPKIIATIIQSILALAVASQVSTGITALSISLKLLLTSTVGLATLGIGALIVGFILLYKNNEWFRGQVDRIWKAVQGYFAAFLGWIQGSFIPWWQNTAMPVITSVFSAIGLAAQWLWSHVLMPVFSAMGPLIEAAFQIVKGAWLNILWPIIKVIGSGLWWLLKNVVWPVTKALGVAFYDAFKVVMWAWTHILNPLVSAIGKALNGDFVGAWRDCVTAIKGIWDGLKQIIAVPVNEAIDILNGLAGGLNKVFAAFGSSIKIPLIAHVTWGQDAKGPTTAGGVARSAGGGASYKGGKTAYDTGGYTGPGGKYEPAGIVHRDEYVLRKEATTRLRKRFGLGWLDHLNAFGEVPGLGYSAGGLVDFGHKLQSMGFNVAEHPKFGGVHPVHTKGSLHYLPGGGAVDVNYDGHGQGFETNKINSILGLAKQYGLRTIWQTAGHYDHAHFDIGTGADIGKSSTPPWISAPLGWLRGLVGGLMGKLPGSSPFAMGLKAMPTAILDGVTAKINALFGSTGELGDHGTQRQNNPTYGVQQWRGLVNKALGLVGQPLGLADLVLSRMNQESSGDDHAINLWDSNAKAGTPSKGLMQLIDPTFKAFRLANLSGNIFDPLSNIVASLRYAISRYGSVGTAFSRLGGYATGGLVGGYRDNGAKMYDNGGMLQPGWTQVLNATGKPEPVFTHDQWQNGIGSGKASLVGEYHQHFHGDDGSASGAFADEFVHTLRRIEYGGVYAGRTP